MKVLCTICARANSKGIKNKNFKKLNNKPLISHTIEIAKKIKFFSKIALSSDSNKIQQITKKYKLDYIISRSKKLSGDKVGKVKVIQDALKKSENKFDMKFDYIVDLDVTSILRNKSDIESSFKKIKSENADNLVSVTEARKNSYFKWLNSIKIKINFVKKSKKEFFQDKLHQKCMSLMQAFIYGKDVLLEILKN